MYACIVRHKINDKIDDCNFDVNWLQNTVFNMITIAMIETNRFQMCSIARMLDR